MIIQDATTFVSGIRSVKTLYYPIRIRYIDPMTNRRPWMIHLNFPILHAVKIFRVLNIFSCTWFAIASGFIQPKLLFSVHRQSNLYQRFLTANHSSPNQRRFFFKIKQHRILYNLKKIVSARLIPWMMLKDIHKKEENFAHFHRFCITETWNWIARL